MRVGVDLVAVDSGRASLAAPGERYLASVFTKREVNECPPMPGWTPNGWPLAAAKEAVLKVLRPADVGVPLTSIEFVRSPQGWAQRELTGPAAALAADQGVSELAVCARCRSTSRGSVAPTATPALPRGGRALLAGLARARQGRRSTR
jgi:holo-[acyl-carrier protein] synthase